MGWYVKTEKQLLETGWQWHGEHWLYIDWNSPVVIQNMLDRFGGKHYLGPDISEVNGEVIWEGYTWVKSMLIWVEE